MANTELLKKIKQDATEMDITKYRDSDTHHSIVCEEMAREYASTYVGDFTFMLDIQQKVWENKSLSDAQIAAILNCALREAKSLSPDITDKQEPLATEHEFVLTNKPGLVVHKVNNVKTGEIYTFTDEGKFVDIEDINSKMQAIEDRLKEVEQENVVESLATFIDQTDAIERKLLAEVEEKVKQLRAEKLMKRAELRSVEANVKELKIELARLATQKEKQIDLVEAEKRLEEITRQLEEFKKEAIWGETVHPYQWDDICYMVAAFMDGKNGVLNANDMGLGKTFESVAVLWMLRKLFPTKYGYQPKILWLTKKSLIKSSIREFRKWDPETTPIPVTGKPNQREFIVDIALANGHPVVVNYDALNTTEILRTTPWDIVVMDEVHKLKGGSNYNPTKVWENTADVCSRAKFILPLSGSPIQNHPKEMWAYLYMLDPVRFPDVNTFVNQYCFGYDEGLTVQWEQLIKILSNRVIRKSVDDVNLQLPDKIYDLREVTMLPEQRKIYDSLRDKFFVWLDEQEDSALTATSILAQLTRLRQVAIMPKSVEIETTDKFGNSTGPKAIDCDESAKLDEAMDIIEQVLAEGKQLVVFSSQFNAPLFELERRIADQFKVKCETITGENSSQIDPIEERFKTGETRILCINMKTGGEGLNLQAASHAIFLDLWWNPESNRQAEARLYRQGQKNTVVIHILQAEESVDQYIQSILDKKNEMITGVMEDSTFRKESGWRDYLTDLI